MYSYIMSATVNNKQENPIWYQQSGRQNVGFLKHLAQSWKDKLSHPAITPLIDTVTREGESTADGWKQGWNCPMFTHNWQQFLRLSNLSPVLFYSPSQVMEMNYVDWLHIKYQSFYNIKYLTRFTFSIVMEYC